MSLGERDRKRIWHPFTQEKTAPFPLGITEGQGAYLYDEHGNKYLDLISSWWANLHGHSHPYIAKAIYTQALQLEHVLFAGFTHPPAVRLCEALSEELPPSLSRYFFSDNGSTAVEVALKVAYQYWSNRGEQERRLFLAFEGGYHGDTFGAMAVGRSSGFHTPFSSLFFRTEVFSYPYTWDGDVDVDAKEAKSLDEIEAFLALHAAKSAAFILEPLMQGASGMRLCRPSFVRKLCALLKEHGILIIFDEVMTGFGRTGSLLAADQIGWTPDLLCLSKGLTGGFLPMALTLVSETVYQGFLSDQYSSAFSHGHTYTANPLGCAAALASFELLKRPEVRLQWKKMQEIHEQGMAYLEQNFPLVQAPRVLGTIAAFNLHNVENSYAHASGKILAAEGEKEGLLLRPLGNTVYLLPPYCITDAELEGTYAALARILSKIQS